MLSSSSAELLSSSGNRTQQALPSTNTNQKPPRRPPKPVKYQQIAVQYSARKGNVNVPVQQNTSGRNPLREVDRVERNGQSRADEKTSPTTAGVNSIATSEPTDRSFERMHHDFDPRNFKFEEVLVNIEIEQETPQNLLGPVGIYGVVERQNRDIDTRSAPARFMQRNHKNGTSMTNPNYSEILGEEIKDSAFMKIPQIARDVVKDNRDLLGDDDDYETATWTALDEHQLNSNGANPTVSVSTRCHTPTLEQSDSENFVDMNFK